MRCAEELFLSVIPHVGFKLSTERFRLIAHYIIKILHYVNFTMLFVNTECFLFLRYKE